MKVTIEATEFPVYAIDAAGRSIYIPQGSIGSFYAEAHVSVKRVEPIENAKVVQPMAPAPTALADAAWPFLIKEECSVEVRVIRAKTHVDFQVIRGRGPLAPHFVGRRLEVKGKASAKWLDGATIAAQISFKGFEDGYKAFLLDVGLRRKITAFQINDLEN